mmetsp:Transcript_14350/g.43454  ORF Transcript_14350/g.43454 Transcript_14350/m.43454 type:complete len:80 (-) Transcript_14350:20-259(-)
MFPRLCCRYFCLAYLPGFCPQSFRALLFVGPLHHISCCSLLASSWFVVPSTLSFVAASSLAKNTPTVPPRKHRPEDPSK